MEKSTDGSYYLFSFQEIELVVLGDTTTVFDLKINQINVNKYAFEKIHFAGRVFDRPKSRL